METFKLDKSTAFKFINLDSSAGIHAENIFRRDFKTIFGEDFLITDNISDADVIVSIDKKYNLCEEAFEIDFEISNKTQMVIKASDDLGIMYALLYISENYFGILPFWFWMDQQIERKEFIEIPIKAYQSIKRFPRYRGWFVNDEDCLIGWSKEYPPTEEVWYPVFEALLRCGGNMVLPGTDLPTGGVHFSLASEMGLWITQHHAAPLDAQLFLRAYPNLEPSYDKHKELFEGLWEEAVRKNIDKKVVWVLGFRGQGDIPFWENDSKYIYPQDRGKVISQIIKKQYTIIKKYIEKPVCAVYLYQESMELYKQGYLQFDSELIKIWSDNGYGKMITRRHGEWDERIEALPSFGESDKHGIYYHLAFHDLEASNHLTMIGVMPSYIAKEISEVNSRVKMEYMLINCSNVKQHLIGLETIRHIWNGRSVDNEKIIKDFIDKYYYSCQDKIYELIDLYYKTISRYGPYEDSIAGDEYYHHPIRRMANAWIGGFEPNSNKQIVPYLNKDNLGSRINEYKSKCEKAVVGWETVYKKANETAEEMKEKYRKVFEDSFVVQTAIHYYGCVGAVHFCSGYNYFAQQEYISSFMELSRSINAQKEVLKWFDKVQHGKWENFYKSDWLTNVGATLYTLEAVRSYIRIIGDGPDLFFWHKHYIMPEEERNIYLENTQREVFSDDEIFELLEKVL